jgi:hypothetical protein
MDILDSRIDWTRCLVQAEGRIRKVDKIVPFGGSRDDIHKVKLQDSSTMSVDESGIGHNGYDKREDECGRVLFVLKDDKFCDIPDLKVEYEEVGGEIKITGISGWAEHTKLPYAYNYSNRHMDVCGPHLYIYDTVPEDITVNTGSKYTFYVGTVVSKKTFIEAMELAKEAKAMYYKIKEVIRG